MIEDETFGLTYRYDPWNRLVAIIDGEEDGEAYEYDALGRRIVEGAVQTVPVGYDRHLYYNDAWQVIHDERPALMADPRGQPIVVYYEFNAYYWSAVGGDTMIGRARDVNDDTIYDEKLYSLQDAQGNQSALADLTGEIVERAIQTPYGDQTTTTKNRQPQQPSVYEWLYFHQGLRLDRTGQFYDNRYRFYSPTLMRFIQNDPIGFAAGDGNLYRYVGNGPVSGTDPWGLDEIPTEDFTQYLIRLAERQRFSGPLDENGQPTERSGGPVQNPGLAWRVSGRILQNTVGAPQAIIYGLSDSYSTLRVEEGASPVLAGAATPFLFIARAIQGLGEAGTRVVIGQGTAEDCVDLGLAAAPFLPKLGRGRTTAPAANPAHSAANYARLKEGYRQAEEYGVGGYRQLENGRFRFYGDLKCQRALKHRQ